VLLSLARMNRVRAIDTMNDTLTVEAGCILRRVQSAAREAGRLFPLSLAAEGSCTLGGNLVDQRGRRPRAALRQCARAVPRPRGRAAPTARSGTACAACARTTPATTCATCSSGRGHARRDHRGDLKLFPLPAARMTAIAAVASPHAALRCSSWRSAGSAATLTGFEMMSDLCGRWSHGTCRRPPFRSAPHPYYVLLESPTPRARRTRSAVRAPARARVRGGLVTDAAVAQSIAQSRRVLGAAREHPRGAGRRGRERQARHLGAHLGDRRLRRAHRMRCSPQRFPGIRMVVFGHLGDGNLHYNVSTRRKGGRRRVHGRARTEINAVVLRRGCQPFTARSRPSTASGCSGATSCPATSPPWSSR
jgi:FAD/FMN-containing dehydrogenase